MASLREIETAFVNAVLFDERAELASHIVANGIEPARRVGIYRNNACETVAGTLAATYPVLERLAGSDWLRQTAREYMQRYPSRSGNLHYLGANLPSFLDKRLHGTRYAYFADVARLEWAYQEVLVAAESAALDIARLEGVPAEEHGCIVFELAPAARLVASPWPLLAIWRANRPESEPADDAGPIDLDSGPSRLLVIRRMDHVELRELPATEYTFLDGCRRGATLESLALAAAPGDGFAETLVNCVRSGALSDFHLTPPAGGRDLASGEF
jgi:Putative DNA-binding domain